MQPSQTTSNLAFMTDSNAAIPSPSEGDDRLAYRIPKVAYLLDVGEWTVRTLIKDGHLRHRKVGKYFVVPHSEIVRYLAEDEPQSA